MKLGRLTAIAVLATAMTLGGAVIPADAGKKGKRAHQSNGRVHISPTVSDKNLEKLQRKLEGSSRHRATTNAIGKEIHDRRTQRVMGQMLDTEDGASAIMSFGGLADEILNYRRRKH
jgi:hypothetical protein